MRKIICNQNGHGRIDLPFWLKIFVYPILTIYMCYIWIREKFKKTFKGR